MSSLKRNIRVLFQNDTESFGKLVKDYVEKEALCQHMKLTEEDKNIFLQTYIEVGVQGTSVGCFDEESGDICAVGIGSLASHHVTSDTYLKYGKASPQFEILTRFEDYMEHAAINYVGSHNFLLIEVTLVKPQFQRQGFLKEIELRLEDLARQHGCDAIAGMVNSQRIANYYIKNGYSVVKRDYYDEYRDAVTGESVFADLPSFHKCCTLVVKMLKTNEV